MAEITMRVSHVGEWGQNHKPFRPFNPRLIPRTAVHRPIATTTPSAPALRSPCMQGVRRFAKAMHSDDEEAMASLMDEEVATTARDVVGNEEIQSILVTLLAMISEEDKPIIGGSALGRRKSKPRQRIEFLVFGADPYEWMGPLTDVDHQDYSSSRTLHTQLIQSGFMHIYNCWTKQGEKEVMMEDNEEEEEEEDDDDDDTYPMFLEYGDTATGEAEDQEALDDPADDLGWAIADAKRECETEKERLKFE
ncbi:hypothetical protein QYE76_021880 [Lolium multiflorum]|uniref:Uncharacterized protein n=1 Tax=Lolium multiflorum TaxID=4521 RepID=A0AAD8RBP3_LOLMU|nr:hypothetical protein QYE76_021880 [Lolium multiflorum]